MSEMSEHQDSAADGSSHDPAHDGAHDGAATGDRTPRAVDQRCPSCGALRPPEVAWCTQCYARFDVPGGGADGATSPDVDGPASDVAAPAAPAPDDDLGPVHREGSGPSVPPGELEARAEQMLARLSADRDDDERVRSWSGRLIGRGPKVAAIVVGTLVLTGLLLAGMAVVGALL